MGRGMNDVCGFRSTQSGTPCQNPIAPGTTHCAASHPVDAARFVHHDAVGATALLNAFSTFDFEEVAAAEESSPHKVTSPSVLTLLKDPAAAGGQPVIEWRKPDGTLHRNPAEGPAVICLDGSQQFYVDGQLHRMDGPAVIDIANQVEKWYRHGELGRLGAKPAVDDTSPVPYRETDKRTGVITWAITNPTDEGPTKLRHNRWAPAIVHPDGTEECWVIGQRHCVNGRPAISSPDGATRHFVFGAEVADGAGACGCD